MSGLLPFAVLYGALLGARHALEPDHVAAVSTLAAGMLLTAARLPLWLAGRAELVAGGLLLIARVTGIIR